MKKKYLYALATIILLASCNTDKDPFLVAKGQIGKLTAVNTIKDLDSIYKEDSLVKIPGRRDYRFGNNDKYLIYEKGGKHLLTIVPSSDSIQAIQNIRVFDDRFKTIKGVSLNSTFKDLSGLYTISKVESVLNNIIISIDEIDAYFTIDKQELPAELRFDRTKKIEAVHIPDNAKIKYFMLGWE